VDLGVVSICDGSFAFNLGACSQYGGKALNGETEITAAVSPALYVVLKFQETAGETPALPTPVTRTR